MSIAGHQRNPERSPFDDYPTPAAYTKALLDRVTLRGPVWEPAAGSGQMAAVLQEYGYQVKATDLERDGANFLEHSGEWDGSIVTNPPFKHLDAFLRVALESATEQVAFLFPIHGVGGKRRSEWLWGPQPPALMLVVPKYMTVVTETRRIQSQFLHVWCVWDHRYDGPTEWNWAAVPAWDLEPQRRGKGYL